MINAILVRGTHNLHIGVNFRQQKLTLTKTTLKVKGQGRMSAKSNHS